MPQIFDTQNAFNAGELSPLMLGRSDVPAYAQGLRVAENFLILRTGALERRPGTVFTAELPPGKEKARLIRFIASEDEAFVLEFTHEQIRIYTLDANDRLGLVLQPSRSFDQASKISAARDEFMMTNHGLQEGDGPFYATSTGTLPTGMAASTEYWIKTPDTHTVTQATGVDTSANTLDVGVNQLVPELGPYEIETTGTLPGGLDATKNYYVKSVAGDLITVAETAGGATVNISSAGSGSMTFRPTAEYKRNYFRLANISGGVVIPLAAANTGTLTLTLQGTQGYRVHTPYAEDELFDLDFARVQDVMFLVHRNHPVHKLTRFASDVWELREVALEDGPYLDEQETAAQVVQTDVEINPAATTGTRVNFVASSPIFFGSDVNRPIRYSDDGKSWGWGVIVGVEALDFTDLSFRQQDANAINAGADTLTITGHPFVDGEGPVRFNIDQYGLVQSQDYYIHYIDANTVSIHLTEANALADTSRVDLTSGSGTLRCTSSVITKTSHGLADRAGPLRVTTTGTLPPRFSESVDYYAINVGTNAFALTTTPGGQGIAPNIASGSGVHSVQGEGVPVDTVEVDIRRALPAATASTRWRIGAFSSASNVGWPEAITFHQQRMVLAGQRGDPQKIHASKPDLFEIFEPDDEDLTSSTTPKERVITSASGWSFEVASEELSGITWMRSLRALICGSLGGLWNIQATNLKEAVSPLNVSADRTDALSCSSISPILINDQVVFVDRSHRRVHAAKYSFEKDGISPTDLQTFASHLGQQGKIVQATYENSELQTAWFARDDGVLLASTIDNEQRVVAWARHTIGGAFVPSFGDLLFAVPGSTSASLANSDEYDTGDRVRVIKDGSFGFTNSLVVERDYYLSHCAPGICLHKTKADAIKGVNPVMFEGGGRALLGLAKPAQVESVAALPGVSIEDGDVLALVVKRTIGGVTKRYVEYMAPRFGEADDQRTFISLDSAPLALDLASSESAVTTIAGLDHLEGQTLQAVADGGVVHDLVVSGGQVTLPEAVRKAVVGLAFRSIGRPFPPSIQNAADEIAYRTKRIIEVNLVLNRTLGLKVGASLENLVELQKVPRLVEMDAPPPLTTGVQTIPPEAGYDKDSGLYIVQDDPVPAQILAYQTRVQFGQR